MTILEGSRIKSIEVSSAGCFDFAPVEKLYYLVENFVFCSNFCYTLSPLRILVDRTMGMGQRRSGSLRRVVGESHQVRSYR